MLVDILGRQAREGDRIAYVPYYSKKMRIGWISVLKQNSAYVGNAPNALEEYIKGGSNPDYFKGEKRILNGEFVILEQKEED